MQRTVTSGPPKRRPELARGFKTRAESLALAVRRELGITVEDPFDPWKLAARRGVQVIELQDLVLQGFSAAGLRHLSRNPRVSAAYDVVDGMPFVLLFGERAQTRRMSDLAHELSHHELGHMPTEAFNSIGCRKWNAPQEAEANWLAGCLLVPAEGALAVLKRGLTLGDAAATFNVSRQMFVWRANMTGAMKRAGLGRGGTP